MGRVVRDFLEPGELRIGRPSRHVELPEPLQGAAGEALRRVDDLKTARPLPGNHELSVLEEQRAVDRVAIDGVKREIRRSAGGDK